MKKTIIYFFVLILGVFILVSCTSTTEKESSNMNQKDNKEDCGSIATDMLLKPTSEKTEQQNKAISCFNKNLVDCSLASFKTTGADNIFYEIKNKEGDYCIISLDLDSAKKKTCKLPMNFIKISSDRAEADGNVEFMFMPIIMGLSFGQATDTVTGEKIIFECG